MTAVVLAAAAGMSYGASDFSGAVASKDNDSSAVAALVQVVSLFALSGIVAFSTTNAGTGDLVWGAIAGIGGGLGLATFYRALALGPMSTAAALTALVSAAVPVLAGLALGDRPAALTLIGIGLAVPAGVLVAAGGTATTTRARWSPRDHALMGVHKRQTQTLSVVAGFGFGVFFIALSRTSDEAGLMPLVSARAMSVAALVLFMLLTGAKPRVGRRSWAGVVVAGFLDCAANVMYLQAVRGGDFTWVAALSSLYPVSTVLLARLLLNERLHRLQVVGLAMAAGAMTLVALGA